MTRDMLLSLSAVAAILGGGLRVVDGFLNNADIHVQQVAYFLTDVMLIFGLCGIYLSRSNRLGLAGLFGFALSITGILMVRSFGQGAYLVGASVTLLGMVVLSVVMLAKGTFPKLAPILWIASLVVGVIGLLVRVNWGLFYCYAAADSSGPALGTSTILPITPPFPSNSCACFALSRGNRPAINGLIFCC
jgi:hypothetical protein